MRKLLTVVTYLMAILASSFSLSASYAMSKEEMSIQSLDYEEYDYSEKLVDQKARDARKMLNIEEEDLSGGVSIKSLVDGVKSISEGQKWSDGGIYWGDRKSASVLSTILDVGLYVAGSYIGEVYSVVIDVAGLIYGIAPNEIDYQKSGEAKVGVSYVYQTKYGKSYVADASSWITHVFIEQRFIYKHEHAVFTPIGSIYAKQNTVDFTPNNGYSHIRNDKRPYYNNHDIINYLIEQKHNFWGTPAYQIYSDGYSFG